MGAKNAARYRMNAVRSPSDSSPSSTMRPPISKIAA
jgi:hypothetical protein